MASANSAHGFDAFVEEKYIPLDKKIKIAIVAAAILIPAALFFFLFYQPTAKKISSLDQKITKAKSELAKAKRDSASLPKLKRELAATKARFEEAAVVLPKTSEIPNLLRSIADLGKGAGLDFISFKPGKESPKDFYAEIPIDISIRGPYHNLGFFLDQVSKLERIVSVNNIKMGSPKTEGGEMLLNSSCRLVTYRFTNTKATTGKDKGKKSKRRKNRRKKKK